MIEEEQDGDGATFDEDPPIADERTTGLLPSSPTGPSASRDAAYGGNGDGWTAAQWEDWWHGLGDDRHGERRCWRWRRDESQAGSQTLQEPEWEKFQLQEIDVLPKEVLGWLLLRRADLPSHARLSVLAATNNKLDLDLVEQAMRDQEEELLLAKNAAAPRGLTGKSKEASGACYQTERGVMTNAEIF